MNLFQKILIACIGIMLVSGTTACLASAPGQETVVVRPGDLSETAITDPQNPEANTALVDVDALKESGRLPQHIAEAIEKFFPEEPVVAVTTREHVSETVHPSRIFFLSIPTVFDEDGTASVDTEGVIGAASGLISAVAPQAVPFLPLVALLGRMFTSKRQRKHTTAVVKALLPLNGSVELGTALKEADKVIGGQHSEDSAEDLAEALNRVARIEERTLVVVDGKVEVK